MFSQLWIALLFVTLSAVPPPPSLIEPHPHTSGARLPFPALPEDSPSLQQSRQSPPAANSQQRQVQMPNLIGVDSATARKRLEALELGLQITTQLVPDPQGRRDIVLRHLPAAGDALKPKQPVTLYIAQPPTTPTPQPARMPNLIGVDTATARGRLEGLRLGLQVVTQLVPDPQGRRDIVLRHLPAAGAVLEPKQPVTLYIAQPPITSPPTQPSVRMPDLTGLDSATATRRLAALELGLQFFTELETDRQGRRDIVVRHVPAAGEILTPRQRVTLYIAQPPPPPTPTQRLVRMPDLIGLDSVTANRRLAALEMGLQVTTELVIDQQGKPGTVTRHLPAAGAALTPRQQVILSIAQPPVRMPDLRGLSSVAAREQLDALKLDLQISTELVTDSQSRPNTITRHLPAPGAILTPRQQVILSIAQPLVRMPDLRGLSSAAAREQLDALKFDLQISTPLEIDPQSRPNTITRHLPAPGAVLTPKQQVTLYIAQPLPRMPDLRGLSIAEARGQLDALKFDLQISTQFEIDPQSKPDTITRHLPAPGAILTPRQQVTLSIAQPPVRMPDLHGLSIAEAREKLDALNLGLQITQKLEPDLQSKPDTVTRHIPAPGAVLTPKEQVTLYIAQPPVRMPDLHGLSSAAARERLEALTLDLQISTPLEPDPQNNPNTVTRHIPVAGTVLTPREQVTLYIAQPPVRMPDLRGLSGAAARERLEALKLDLQITTQFEPDPQRSPPTITQPTPAAQQGARSSISQHIPAAGVFLTTGQQVTLYLAPPPPPPPPWDWRIMIAAGALSLAAVSLLRPYINKFRLKFFPPVTVRPRSDLGQQRLSIEGKLRADFDFSLRLLRGIERLQTRVQGQLIDTERRGNG